MQGCIEVYAALHRGLCSIASRSMQHCIEVYAALHRGLCCIALRSMQHCIEVYAALHQGLCSSALWYFVAPLRLCIKLIMLRVADWHSDMNEAFLPHAKPQRRKVKKEGGLWSLSIECSHSLCSLKTTNPAY